jgi:hypothetical protein
MKTARERADVKRQEKPEFVAEQAQTGRLVVRHMTEEERRHYPPLPSASKRSGKG